MAYRKVILMYHSVASAEVPAVLGSYPISLERFQSQIVAARQKGWQFGRISELWEPVSADTLYITSDDGTVDWARTALPWCESQRIPTHTAIITGPWRDEPIYPVAHRVQVLLKLPRELPKTELTAEQREYIDRVYFYETEPRRRYFKGALNMVLDDASARDLLGPPSEAEREELERRFAAADEYRDFQFAEIGVHTEGHGVFGGDAETYLTTEILPCRDMLLREGFRVTDVFTIPLVPRFPATPEQLVPGLEQHGFRAMLVGQGLWNGEAFIVPRIDAINAEEVLGLECEPAGLAAS